MVLKCGKKEEKKKEETKKKKTKKIEKSMTRQGVRAVSNGIADRHLEGTGIDSPARTP